jgi:uncharacterized protein YeaO (DUF488 family)
MLQKSEEILEKFKRWWTVYHEELETGTKAYLENMEANQENRSRIRVLSEATGQEDLAYVVLHEVPKGAT